MITQTRAIPESPSEKLSELVTQIRAMEQQLAHRAAEAGVRCASPRELGDALQKARQALGISGRQLAADSELTTVMLRNLENGTAKGIVDLFELCEFLGVELWIKR
ncbi:helix-turn-helix transcriptional regulator [Pseudomaricurvus alkylphenolicus]|uniref:helix-turn-helix domain-containing protein n=1 Tax=Pseudomaricurvus alkylphenolicus TaxID=1306991 RepID=UPI00141E3F0E|nr:helix-turn-helix transcriptional regulator [Pseudomaricurvus alkylphenolicus]NIB44353.1 helix-turn-helix transcriptional regulator [Pseudomaricurvus alkylphenolicus]